MKSSHPHDTNNQLKSDVLRHMFACPQSMSLYYISRPIKHSTGKIVQRIIYFICVNNLFLSFSEYWLAVAF